MRPPSLVVDEQSATSIELAIVVCSLLIGVGYTARVVQGSAVTQLVAADTSGIICPFGPPKPEVKVN